MIVINNLSKKFNIGKKNELTAINDISLTINDGEMVAIMGRSGAGKSTLMHILGCLDSPTSGSYFLDKEQIDGLSEGQLAIKRNRKIGILLQDFALVNNDTALQNVMTPLFFSKVPILKMKAKTREALSLVGIEALANQKVGTMSGGQKQRVALARTLVNNPSVILADEPTGALDSNTADEIMLLLQDFNNKGVTVVIVTHDIKIAGYCKRIIEIADGVLSSDKVLEENRIDNE
ncbi:ABC transporter related protein [Ruminiclostridium papyrosolvens DSM 2782]|uniref:ABC transporter related protein n=1 Tax=Ruminiclostridium papyrosolvens DSM 2782 TaxID=588581 RepID=F1T8E4_9FIRM|nr:ABC transporter ATP-binding protein [Ruminiclostridium papyrosolvens]EGD49742.1 ABC transporter related protein [Ruminiclostridium papyrosolvens DSM 2782]WES33131.1 ABC transporter ATP-binding protein [Ruminiclostridium papyrosolvens DSM 2782]